AARPVPPGGGHRVGRHLRDRGVRDVTDHELLAGWANTAPSAADVVRPTTRDELVAAARFDDPRGTIARGLGRSYGDPALNAGGTVIDATGVSGLLDLDVTAGRVRALAGTSLEDLMRWLVPLGW